MDISHDLQTLLNAITDAAGRTAITDALNSSPELLTMYNNLANVANGVQKLTATEWNPDPNDKTDLYTAGVMHTGFCGLLITQPSIRLGWST